MMQKPVEPEDGKTPAATDPPANDNAAEAKTGDATAAPETPPVSPSVPPDTAEKTPPSETAEKEQKAGEEEKQEAAPAEEAEEKETVMGAAMDALEKRIKRSVPYKVFEQFFKIIGFGAVWEAAQKPTKRTKHVLSSLFNKAADMAAGRMVVGTIKIMTITALAGMVGGSIYMTMGLTALATGTGAAIYTYAKNYLADKIKMGSKASFFTWDRVKKSVIAFGTSAAGGAFGAWLIKTEFMQGILHGIKETVAPSGSKLSEVFNEKTFPILPASPPDTLPKVPPVLPDGTTVQVQPLSNSPNPPVKLLKPAVLKP